MSNKYTNLVEILEQKEERFHGSDEICGMTLLGFPSYTDSARSIMYTNHLKQRVVLKDTQFPRVFTNYCNIMGDNSSYNVRADADIEIVNIIQKFSKIDSKNQPYLIFYRNLKTDEYDVIERFDVENLPEKYGFAYDNSVLDSLKVGDVVKEGDTLYHPTSYDEFGNYGFGRNVKFMYMVNDQNIEDAITVSESLAKSMISYEVEEVKVMINENNFLLNIYGDNEGHYKSFPDIGEKVKDKHLCTWRLINNSQLLFDLKSANTRKPLSSDTTYYIDGEIVDINIYSNKPREEIVDSEFNGQVLEYLDMTIEFKQKVLDYTQELIDSGKKVSANIKTCNKNAREYLSPEYKFKDENNSVFSNIVIYFLVKRPVGLYKGQKLTGRYGNKGVTAKIIPDHMMPHLETGERVDIIFDTLGVINRLNVFQLFEQSITFITNRAREEIARLDNFKDKEKLLFDIIAKFNTEQSESVKADYKESCKTKADKEYYFDIIDKYGIFIHIPPFWQEKNLYDCLVDCYKTYGDTWLKPYQAYFYQEDTDRWVPLGKPQPIGDMYVMKMKQSSKKGLSARSTGPINKRGVPEKTNDAKKHTDPYSRIPVRFGQQEYQIQIISIPSEIIAKENMFYRSSIIGRRALGSELLEHYDGVTSIEMMPTMTNRNVEVLSAYMKPLGAGLQFSQDVLDLSKEPGIKTHTYKGRKYWCTSEEMIRIVSRDLAMDKIQKGEQGAIYFGDDKHFDTFVDEVAEEITKDIVDYLS